MVDRLPALRRRAMSALQKGGLPTQQVDDVPTLHQSGCPALPRRRQQCARSQMRADDWPDSHRCAFVDCCLRLTSHIDFGIPTRSRLCHRDLDDVCVPPQNSPSRLPGRPGQPQEPLVDHRVPLVDHSPRRATPWSTYPFRQPELSAGVDELPSSTAAHFSGRRTALSTSRSNSPSWSTTHPLPRPVSCSCRAPWSTTIPQRSPAARRNLSSSSPTADGRLLLPYIRPSRRRCPSEGGANTSLPLPILTGTHLLRRVWLEGAYAMAAARRGEWVRPTERPALAGSPLFLPREAGVGVVVKAVVV
ncbi:unnamed protein product [Closterium sp. NIES-53]